MEIRQTKVGLLLIGLFWVVCASSSLAEPMESFYGSWVSSNYNNKACKKIRDETVGITIYQNFYIPLLGGFCEDVKLFMRGDNLLITANCFSDEGGGHSAITNVIKMLNHNTIQVVEGFDLTSQPHMKYFRRVDCRPHEKTCIFGGDPTPNHKRK
jgi:hypothetical protein